MGRRRLWIIVGAILSVGSALVWLALLREDRPLEFLGGRSPSRVVRIGAVPRSFAIYEWVEDREAVGRRARAELLGKGWREVHKMHEWLPRFTNRYRTQVVSMRSHKVGSRIGVQVEIASDDHQPALWDRVLAVFGL